MFWKGSKNKDGNVNSLLRVAAAAGNLKRVQELLNLGADLNSKDKFGATPLHKACWKGHLEIVEWLVEVMDAIVDTKNKVGWTPLHEACNFCHLKVAKWLVENGADINATNNKGSTPLHRACNFCHLEMAKWLVNNGADINAKRNDGSTPLHWACLTGRLKVVNWLVENGASVHAINCSGQTPSDCIQSDDKKGPQIREILSKPLVFNSFYGTIFDSKQREEDLQHVFGNLATLVSDIHEMKLYYTMARYCQRQKMVDDSFCRTYIFKALETTAQTCGSEDAIVVFKLILIKAKEDGLLTDPNFHRLDNRGELTRVSQSTFIIDMKEAITKNTSRIEQLEHHVDATQKMIAQFKKAH